MAIRPGRRLFPIKRIIQYGARNRFFIFHQFLKNFNTWPNAREIAPKYSDPRMERINITHINSVRLNPSAFPEFFFRHCDIANLTEWRKFCHTGLRRRFGNSRDEHKTEFFVGLRQIAP